MSNLFIQAVNGSWYFNSLDNFLNDAPYKYTYKYTNPELTGGDLRYAPIMKSGQFGFYAQDKWNINTNLELTYGIRFDIPLLFNDPTTNEALQYIRCRQRHHIARRRNAGRQSAGFSARRLPLVYGRLSQDTDPRRCGHLHRTRTFRLVVQRLQQYGHGVHGYYHRTQTRQQPHQYGSFHWHNMPKILWEQPHRWKPEL